MPKFAIPTEPQLHATLDTPEVSSTEPVLLAQLDAPHAHPSKQAIATTFITQPKSTITKVITLPPMETLNANLVNLDITTLPLPPPLLPNAQPTLIQTAHQTAMVLPLHHALVAIQDFSSALVLVLHAVLLALHNALQPPLAQDQLMLLDWVFQITAPLEITKAPSEHAQHAQPAQLAQPAQQDGLMIPLTVEIQEIPCQLCNCQLPALNALQDMPGLVPSSQPLKKPAKLPLHAQDALPELAITTQPPPPSATKPPSDTILLEPPSPPAQLTALHATLQDAMLAPLASD